MFGGFMSLEKKNIGIGDTEIPITKIEYSLSPSNPP